MSFYFGSFPLTGFCGKVYKSFHYKL